RIKDCKINNEFIALLKAALLSDEHNSLGPEYTARLRNPPEHQLAITDPDVRFSLDILISIGYGAESIYTSIYQSYMRRHPD
ncbi:hypothetical protein NEOLEDRAFT_1039981, partial [Neolentinus lepideus HHB14362 ss-1]